MSCLCLAGPRRPDVVHHLVQVRPIHGCRAPTGTAWDYKRESLGSFRRILPRQPCSLAQGAARTRERSIKDSASVRDHACQCIDLLVHSICVRVVEFITLDICARSHPAPPPPPPPPQLKYPHLLAGSVASSAPVQAEYNFEQYAQVRQTSLPDTHTFSQTCLHAVSLTRSLRAFRLSAPLSGAPWWAEANPASQIQRTPSNLCGVLWSPQHPTGSIRTSLRP